jgi:hypothetical protein
MTKLLNYLLVYTTIIIFLSWNREGMIEEGYERLYWFSVFFIGAIFIVPVLLMDLISQLTKREWSNEKENKTN